MAIWLRTLLVVLVYTAAVVWTNRLLPLANSALRLALAFVLVQSVAIVTMLVVLLTRRGVAQRRVRRSQEVAGAAHAAVSEHAAGADRLRALRGLQAESARDVESAVRSFLAATRGTMHARVATLARDLGIATDAAALSLGSTSLFDRALLADRLPPFAIEEVDSIVALDLLYSWARVLPIPNFDRALTHPDPEIRWRAYRALPYVQPPHDVRPGLADPSPLVRAAAAEAAGKLRDVAAVPQLAALLGDDAAVAAAFALATTPEGVAALEATCHPEPRRGIPRHDDAVASASFARDDTGGYRVAFEALEKATLGRIDA